MQIPNAVHDIIRDPCIVVRETYAVPTLIDGNLQRPRFLARSGSRLMLLVFFAHFFAVRGMLANMYLACALLLNGITSTPSSSRRMPCC